MRRTVFSIQFSVCMEKAEGVECRAPEDNIQHPTSNTPLPTKHVVIPPRP